MAKHANSTPLRDVHFTLPATDLTELSARSLHCVMDAVHDMRHAAMGVYNQPRTQAAPAVVDVLGSFMEDFCDAITAAILKVAADRAPTSPDDAEMLAWLEVKYRAGFMDCMGELGELATRHYVNLQHRRWEKKA